MRETEIRRGEIREIRDGYGNGVTGLGVVVTRDAALDAAEHVMICYMADRPLEDRPENVTVRTPLADYTAQCGKIFTVRRDRIGDCRGRLSGQETIMVDLALQVALGIDVMREPEKTGHVQEPNTEPEHSGNWRKRIMEQAVQAVEDGDLGSLETLERAAERMTVIERWTEGRTENGSNQ